MGRPTQDQVATSPGGWRKPEPQADVVWHRDEEHGYRFASCYLAGPINRSYARGDSPPHYPVPMGVRQVLS